MSRLFYNFGKICASHPWEVIVTFVAALIAMCSCGPKMLLQVIANSTYEQCNQFNSHSQLPSHCIQKSDHENTEVVILTISRCMALLYVYHQFRTLYKLGSKYLVGIAALFTVFSIFIFCNAIFNFLNGNFTEFHKALPFFLLLSDLSKASLLAQFALSSSSRDEIQENIARGMAILGPSLTLDTLVETLAISVGTLSGVTRIEEICCFACLSVIVNYFVFMTVFPACLSLALELSYNYEDGSKPVWKLSSITKVLQIELEQSPNPVIQRVKLIMSAGLMLVHTTNRLSVASDSDAMLESSILTSQLKEPNIIEMFFEKIFDICSDQIVVVMIILILAVRFIFFENKDNFAEHILNAVQQQQQPPPQQEPQQNIEDQTHEKAKNQFTQHSQNNGDIVQRSFDKPSILITQDSDTEDGIDGSICDGLSSRASSTKCLVDDKSKRKSPAFFIGDDSSEFGDTEFVDREVQTDETRCNEDDSFKSCAENTQVRDLSVLKQFLNSEDGVNQLNDLEIFKLVENKLIPAYNLESILGDPERGVRVRRKLISTSAQKVDVLNNVPFTNYDYSLVNGACCENVIGYLPVPLGVAGPLLLNDNKYYVPMATTEGCLIASTNRGCRALLLAGGVQGSVVSDGMTRGPVIRFPSARRVAQAVKWLKQEHNFDEIKVAFDSTSRFGRLERIQTNVAGRHLFVRFIAQTGDAMGMNMLSKGTEQAIHVIREYFPDIEMACLSGNFCTDKKPSAVNWIEGRGKSVVCEAIISEEIVRDVLKTSIDDLVTLNISKNLVGSAMAGSIGGNNAQAANIVAAIYIATGQDPAQTVGSSNCITLLEKDIITKELSITCTMPSIELGTIGGGTVLAAQGACLELLGVRGSSYDFPGSKSREFATVVCATVLAAELSLLSALAAGHLVKSHMKHNRSNISINLQPVPTTEDLLKNQRT